MSHPRLPEDPAFGKQGTVGAYHSSSLNPLHTTAQNATSRQFSQASDTAIHPPLHENDGLQRPEYDGQQPTGEGSGWESAARAPADAGAQKQRGRRGKAPYQWKTQDDETVPSWYRKLARLKHYTSIPVQKIAQALSEAGGPEAQTTYKLMQAYSGEDHGKGRLNNKKGKERRQRGQVRAAKYSQAQQSVRQSGSAALPDKVVEAEYTGTEDDNARGNSDSVPVQESPSCYALPDKLHTLPQAVGTDPAFAGPSADSGAKRQHDDQDEIQREDDEEERRNKRRRRASPRTSAAQINLTRFVQVLVDTTEHPIESLDHLVNRWSQSSTRSYLSSVWSNTTKSRHRSSQQSFHQSNFHEDVQGNIPHRDVLQRDETQPQTVRDECSSAAVSTLRRLFWLIDSAGDDTEERLAEAIYQQLRYDNVTASVATEDGVTALHLAVKLGYPSICGILLWAGANPHAEDDLGQNAYRYAKHAQRAASNDGHLMTRILKCREHVNFGLDGAKKSHPLAPASQLKLQQLCDSLDPNEARKAARACKPLSTITEGQATRAMLSSIPETYGQRLDEATRTQSAMLSPDSGFQGSPADVPAHRHGYELAGDQSAIEQFSQHWSPEVETPLQGDLSPLPSGVFEQQEASQPNPLPLSLNTVLPTNAVYDFEAIEPDRANHTTGATRADASEVRSRGEGGALVGSNFLRTGLQAQSPFTTGGHAPPSSTPGALPTSNFSCSSTHNNMLIAEEGSHARRTPVQSIDPNTTSQGVWQQPSQQGHSSSWMDDFNAFTTEAYRTPGGNGLDHDGLWMAADPLQQSDPQATQPGDMVGRSQHISYAVKRTGQTYEEKSCLLKLLRQHSDRTHWISCRHNHPCNFEESHCRYGCLAPRREQMTEAERNLAGLERGF